jgi:hypothetical protein
MPGIANGTRKKVNILRNSKPLGKPPLYPRKTRAVHKNTIRRMSDDEFDDWIIKQPRTNRLRLIKIRSYNT